jgi:hypothetical protein
VSFTILGGKLGPALSLDILGGVPVTAEDCERNRQKSLGLPSYTTWPKANFKRLAVIGGGPSAKNHVDELRVFDGDIWAINGAFHWAKDNGITATFFAVDPHPIVAQWAEGATKALLEASCDPSAFEVLRDADVATFELGLGDGELRAYGSTASAAPHLSVRMGYRELTFYGCEGCYLPGRTHAYMDEAREEELLVHIDGKYYLTAPDYYLQTQALAAYMREMPREYLNEQSGGLLRALIQSGGEHDVRWISDGLLKTLWRAGDPPKTDKPILISKAYQPRAA